MELEQGAQFDFRAVNDDLGKAIAEVDEIVQRFYKYNTNILIRNGGKPVAVKPVQCMNS